MCNDKLGKEQGFTSPVNAKYLEDWWKNRCTHKSLDQINSHQDLIEFSQKILRDLKATDSQQPSQTCCIFCAVYTGLRFCVCCCIWHIYVCIEI